jgi:hypothetical protein
MAMFQRKKTNTRNVANLDISQGNDSSKKKNQRTLLHKLVLFVVCLLFGLISPMIPLSDDGTTGIYGEDKSWSKYPSANFKISFDWNKVDADGSDRMALGPHGVEIVATCPNAIFYAYLGKDILVDVPLIEKNPMHWVGKFSVPIKGQYEFKVKSSGCKDDTIIDSTILSFEAVGTMSMDDSMSERKGNLGKTLISQGAWISTSKVQIDSSESEQKPANYVWLNPNLVQDKKQVKGIAGASAFVAKEGSVTEENGFFEFHKLSNYEIVCFFGSESANDIFGSFKSLRGNLFPHQRPFKFHYHEVNDFINPDKNWTDGDKSVFRKCKHVLISIDEPESPLSQMEYKSKMITLIKHLTLAFNDETFPLWIFTTMESPINSKNCHSPNGQRRSEHPCNVALKELFQNSPFSSRVRLLDNTDVTNPQIGGLLKADILAAIALRIYIIVGYQVKEWRANNQVGHVKGLTKGDKEIPNFDLVPYDFTKEVSPDKVDVRMNLNLM